MTTEQNDDQGSLEWDHSVFITPNYDFKLRVQWPGASRKIWRRVKKKYLILDEIEEESSRK